MVEVRLHGELAKSFGMVWHLDIARVGEAVAAIDTNRPGFRQKLLELADRGMVYRVRGRTAERSHDFGDDDLNLVPGKLVRVDIIPVILGASAGFRFVAGAVLAAVGYFFGWTGIGAVVGNIGVGLMVGSVVEWLTPRPPKADSSKNGMQSWSISGPTNTVDQGLPVPVIYGEVLTGGYTISAGLTASDYVSETDRSVDTLISGNADQYVSTGGSGVFSASIQLTGHATNMIEATNYVWTVTGFAGASVVVFDDDSATVTIAVTPPALAINQRIVLTGVAKFAVTGFQSENSRDDRWDGLAPQTYSVSKALTLTFDSTVLGASPGSTDIRARLSVQSAGSGTL